MVIYFDPQIEQSQSITIEKDLGPSESILANFSGFYRHKPEHGAWSGNQCMAGK